MKAGLTTMKTEYKKLNIKKIYKMKDEMEEMLDINNDIQDVLSVHYDMPDIDENELEAELDAFGDEIDLDTDTSYLDEALQAPSIPIREPSISATVNFLNNLFRSYIPLELNDDEMDDFLGLPKVPAS